MTADTTVPLRDYMEAKFRHLEEVMTVKFDAQQKAVDLAEHRLGSKLADMNEWRDTISDRNTEFAKQDQVTRIQKWIDTSGGRSQGIAIVAGFLSVIAILLTILRYILVW